MDRYSLRRAGDGDAAAVAELVHAAYEPHVRRIGMQPGPMSMDHAAVIRDEDVFVAELDGTIAGVVVLVVDDDDGFTIENVAVHPSQQAKGLGRALLAHAESAAVRAGFDSVHLFTHELMTENIALYSRIGYVEHDRRCHGTFSLVHMRKPVPSAVPRPDGTRDERRPGQLG